jgi:hypothetical protein
MTPEARRQLDNYLLSTPLSGRDDRQAIDNRNLLKDLARLIEDHDHFREVLLSESNRYERRAKYEGMRGYLKFRAYKLETYEMQERIRGRSVDRQPIGKEKDIYGSSIYPVSRPYFA